MKQNLINATSVNSSGMILLKTVRAHGWRRGLCLISFRSQRRSSDSRCSLPRSAIPDQTKDDASKHPRYSAPPTTASVHFWCLLCVCARVYFISIMRSLLPNQRQGDAPRKAENFSERDALSFCRTELQPILVARGRGRAKRSSHCVCR